MELGDGHEYYQIMPRYHLNLFNNIDTYDEEGRVFEDLTAAKEEAIRSSRDLMAEHVKAGEPINLCHRIEVTDDEGKVLATIDFRELITITDNKAVAV
ncbi:hypothetical protein PX699_17635 [Sphingobium sp. H39-3-25]|uniref:DUF6894 family protein n=1 Tax=Sphingobium arseniciresistens TaxID=3030834 RepID=UPI0023B971DA|nr:hypothetical protein [Sphingobium arseniciresistens]